MQIIIHRGITLDIHPDYSQFVRLHDENLAAFRRHIALHGLGQAMVLHATGHVVTGLRMPTLKDRSICRVEHTPSQQSEQGAITPLDRICLLLSGYIAECLFEGTEYGSTTSIDEWHEAQGLCNEFALENGIPHQHVFAACVTAVESFLGKQESAIEFAAQYLAEAEGQAFLSPGLGHLLNGIPRLNLSEIVMATLKEDGLDDEYERIERLMP